MKSPFYFLVRPVQGKRYNNTKQISGIDFIVSTSEENHQAANREGVVVATPSITKGLLLREMCY